MAKSKRLIELMELVNLKKQFTVQEMADEFQVSYRTMWRYLQELSELGVPLYSEPGVKGGYFILKERALPPIKVNSSSPEIFNQKVQLDEIKVVGYEFTAPYKAFREAEVLIPRLWFRLIEHLEEIGEVVNSNRRIGVSHNRKTDFTYYVTVEVENFTKVPNNMTQLTVPANTYASFYHHGVMERDHIDRTYQFIHNWFEKNQYERNFQSYSLEIYDEHYEPSKSSNRFEILIPVK